MVTLHSLLINAVGQAALWATCYFAIGWLGQAHSEWTSRFLGIIHTLLITGLSMWSFWVGPKPFENYGEPNTYLQELTMSTCVGFYTYDLVWTLYHKSNNTVMIVHHACSIVSLSVVLTGGVSGCEATAGILGLDLANTNFQVRWFIHNSKYRNTLVQTLNEMIFLVLFFASRVVWLSVLTYAVLTHPIPVFVKFFAASMYTLSWIFIVQFILKRHRESNRNAFLE